MIYSDKINEAVLRSFPAISKQKDGKRKLLELAVDLNVLYIEAMKENEEYHHSLIDHANKGKMIYRTLFHFQYKEANKAKAFAGLCLFITGISLVCLALF